MFSVVIPVYNHAAYLDAGVTSALRSPLVDQVLLVDDGSLDGSATVIRQLAMNHPDRVRDLTTPQDGNRGAHERLNQLVRAARTEWIAVLNSDDVFAAGRFELLRDRLRCSDANFACGQLLIVDGTGGVVGTKRGVEQPEFPFPSGLGIESLTRANRLTPLLANQNFIATTSNMVFTRTLFEATGGFKAYRYVHDWDFALRASVVGRCLYLTQFLTLYRNHGHNSIKTEKSLIRSEVRELFAEFQADHPDCSRDPEVAKALAGNRYLQ